MKSLQFYQKRGPWKVEAKETMNAVKINIKKKSSSLHQDH